jgi:hypothetical protein
MGINPALRCLLVHFAERAMHDTPTTTKRNKSVVLNHSSRSLVDPLILI